MGVFTLTIVRHGETQENKDRVIQGHQDTPLSDVGLEQAQLAGVWLQQELFTHAISSDLQRAHTTCELILEKNLRSTCSVEKDPRIRERKFGTFEGRPSVEFQAASRKHRKSSNHLEEFPPGGETIKQLRARAREFFRDLCNRLMSSGSEGSVCGVKRRHQTASSGCEVFSELHDVSALSQHSDDAKHAVSSPKDSGHSSSGSTSSTSGYDSVTTASSLEQLSEKCTQPQKPSSPVAGSPSDACLSQGSSCSSLDESPSEPVTCLAEDNDIHTSIPAAAATTVQYGCPNVSLSPIFEHRLSSMSSISSGRNNSFDDGDVIPTNMAEVLVVSHGGWIQQLFTVFVEELGCKIPGGKKYALQTSPNTGHSRFTVSLEANTDRPTVTCLYIHDKDHLHSQEQLTNREQTL